MEIRKKNFQMIFDLPNLLFQYLNLGEREGREKIFSMKYRKDWNESDVLSVFGRYRSTSCVRIAKSDTEGNCEGKWGRAE